MFGLNIIGEVIGNLFGIGRDYLQGKRELEKAKLDSKIAIEQARTQSAIKVKETGQIADIEWDVTAMQNSQESWKDEWLTILFSIPLVMAFIPGWDVYVYAGFNVLRDTPEWYQITVGVVVAASFGYKKLVSAYERIKK